MCGKDKIFSTKYKEFKRIRFLVMWIL